MAGASAARLALRATGSFSSASVDGLGRLDLLGRAVADEHRLAAPFDRQRHARLQLRDVDLDRRKRQRRGIRAHLVDEGPGDRRSAHGARHAGGDVKEIAACGIVGVGRAHGTRVLSSHDRRRPSHSPRSPTPARLRMANRLASSSGIFRVWFMREALLCPDGTKGQGRLSRTRRNSRHFGAFRPASDRILAEHSGGLDFAGYFAPSRTSTPVGISYSRMIASCRRKPHSSRWMK